MPDDTWFLVRRIEHLQSLRKIDQNYINDLKELHRRAMSGTIGISLFSLIVGVLIGVSIAASVIGW
jgi:ABC-type uncharacterized transport system permease subunit